jgi:hypothetical protein
MRYVSILLLSTLMLCVGVVGGALLKGSLLNTLASDLSAEMSGIASLFKVTPTSEIEPDFIKYLLEEQFYPNLPREGFRIAGHGEHDIYVGGNARVEEVTRFGDNYLVIFKANNTFEEMNRLFGPMYALVVYRKTGNAFRLIGSNVEVSNFYIGYENAVGSRAKARGIIPNEVVAEFALQTRGEGQICRAVRISASDNLASFGEPTPCH